MPELVALLDLGSNATRLLLARIQPGDGFRIVRDERVQTRLGAGPSGKLPRAATALTLESVRRFLAGIGGATPPRVLAVATAAVREAANRGNLLDALRRRNGIDVRILSAEDEGRLGALAALHTLPLRDAVVVDLGGGSLQVTRVRARRVVSVESRPLGVVRLTRRFLHRDPPSPREVRALRHEIRGQLLGALPPAVPRVELVGMGGSVRALARLHLAQQRHLRAPRHGLRLRQSDVTALREQLEALPLRKRRRVRGLKAERADIILAGAIALEELMMFGGYFTLTTCSARVRDGVLWREALDGRGAR